MSGTSTSTHPAASAQPDGADKWGPPVYDRAEAICVIGAGASGLAAVKNLREHGFAVDCYERETGIGGGWNWRHERSPMYASTHMISSKPFTQFPDFPMPDSYPDYPRHGQVLSYFEHYADHFELREHIWFGTEVTRVRPAAPDSADPSRWDVTVRPSHGGAPRTLRYAAVVVANGHNWHPNLPSFAGQEDYAGKIIHAAAYKDVSTLRGKRVLVVGAGNTGCDIAVEAAGQAAAVWHSSRRGYWYTPKYTFGRPSDQVDDLVQSLRMPLRLRQWLYHRLLRVTVGRLTKFGLPKPNHRIYETHPIVNSQLIYHLGHGDIAAKPDVERFARDQVVFSDGSTADPELVILATGYRPRFEFIDAGHLNVDVDGRPRLYLHTFSPKHETLSVAGLIQPDSGQFGIVHWQTVAIARWLRTRVASPERARAFWWRVNADAERSWTKARVTPVNRHWFEVSHQRYLRVLQRSINELEGGR